MPKSDESPTAEHAERGDLAVAFFIAVCVTSLVIVGLALYLWTL